MDPVLEITKSACTGFPSGSRARRVVCYKIIDLLHVVGQRIGRENTRVYMAAVIKNFMAGFSCVHVTEEDDVNDEAVKEIKCNFFEIS